MILRWIFDEPSKIEHSRISMQLLKIYWLFLLFLAMGARAQTTNDTNVLTRPISLEESIELALQHNLDVQISRVHIDVARYNLSIAYADWDPSLSASATHSSSVNPSGLDPQGRPFPPTKSTSDSVAAGVGVPGVGASGLLPSGLTYSLSGNASDTVFQSGPNRIETSRGSAILSMRQPLLRNSWIDTTRLNIKVDKNRLKYSELALRLQIMKVVNNVAQAYYELIFARENIKVQQAALELAERLVAENKKRVQVGTLAPLDEKQAESQAAASRADLLTAQITFENQENVLKGLMTDDYTSLHST